MDLASPTTVKELCEKYDINPRRRQGQNFLIDQNVLNKIIQAADLKKSDLVLEIGAGLGILTKELGERAKSVLTVEIDSRLIKALSETIGDYKNIIIIKEDVLSKEFYQIFKKWLAKHSAGSYKIVANLPYNITSAVLRYFLEADLKPTEMILMVQKEVAERITAKPGQMSLLAVSVQFYGQPEIIDYVSKNSFWPSPKVDSAIIKLKTDQRYQVNPKIFFRIVKIGFSAKRKQLQNNLSAGLKMDSQEIKEILKKIGLDEKIRAQDLAMEDWVNLIGEIRN
ncbi:MAG TPA: 16S rRNA (adenine(1518)-N(6)/adenine(1519)-N(6))-dimethyltransferase RsmA [Patescibacteria group bacterium]